MNTRLLRLASVLVMAWASMLHATTVTTDTSSARAVLGALQNARLDYNAALRIAEMSGNEGISRKSNEFGISANDQAFARALVAAAHGQTVTDPVEKSYYFDSVKAKRVELITLLDRIESDPAAFQQQIQHRIERYTPAGTDLHLKGYVVAGGDGGGYAFGTTDFFLNIGMVDEFQVVKGITTHELYHAVQGAFAKERGAVNELPSVPGQMREQLACVSTAQLFANIYEEGSAVEAEDTSLLNDATSDIGRRKRDDLQDGMRHAYTSASLLEMSVIALNAQEPVPFKNVYDVGFYGHGVLYNVGYVIAKAIAENDGPQGLAVFLKLPAQQFVLRYTQLPTYGKDPQHPRLGPNTVAAATRLQHGCK